MKQIDGDTYLLSSGREVDANRGLIGLASDGGGFEVSGGYDQMILIDDYEEPWTPEECAELADFMIERWRAFKAVRGLSTDRPLAQKQE